MKRWNLPKAVPCYRVSLTAWRSARSRGGMEFTELRVYGAIRTHTAFVSYRVQEDRFGALRAYGVWADGSGGGHSQRNLPGGAADLADGGSAAASRRMAVSCGEE